MCYLTKSLAELVVHALFHRSRHRVKSKVYYFFNFPFYKKSTNCHSIILSTHINTRPTVIVKCGASCDPL